MSQLALPAELRIIDSSTDAFTGDILLPFAFDEVVCRKVGMGVLPPIVHIWRHRRAFVMGLRDRKLPFALEAMGWLEQQGYSAAVRNSGGAAVPLDPGVVNLSIILPNPAGRVDFHQDFELMYRLIQDSMQQLGAAVEKGEIKGSYCPGDFDLSVRGQKFCGIAQRRQTKAFVVQAFVVVEGKGEERASLVKAFYELASGEKGEGNFPQVSLDRMASLQELLQISSAEGFADGLKKSLVNHGGQMGSWDDIAAYQDDIRLAIDELRERYEKRGSKS